MTITIRSNGIRERIAATGKSRYVYPPKWFKPARTALAWIGVAAVVYAMTRPGAGILAIAILAPAVALYSVWRLGRWWYRRPMGKVFGGKVGK